MEIYQLRTLLAVARLGHLTRAADQLHMTQPAVSKQIRALEDDLGVTLFERGPGGTVPTKACQALLPHAEETVRHANALADAARSLRGGLAGSIRLGTIVDPESLRLGGVLSAMLQQHPLVDIRLQHGISGQVLERVLNADLDAGFYLGDIADQRIDAVELKQVNYRIIAPRAWAPRLAGAGWEDLAALPWVGTPAHSSQHRIVRDLFAARRLVPRYTVEADQEASMLAVVVSGAALCIMREEIAEPAEARGQLHVLRDHLLRCKLLFFHLRGREAEPALGALRAVVGRVWERAP